MTFLYPLAIPHQSFKQYFGILYHIIAQSGETPKCNNKNYIEPKSVIRPFSNSKKITWYKNAKQICT